MPTLAPQDVLAKWKQRTSAAAQDYVTGAQNTDKDPTQLAINAIPRMRQNVLAAIDDGKVANGLRRAGKTGWLSGIASKGAQNFSSGVANADEKFLAAFTPLLSYIDNAKRQVAAMPNLTDADRDQRMLRMAQLMRQYRAGA